MMKIVCVGDCGVDHYLPGNEQYFGGISANFARRARHAFQDDDSITVISAIGDDANAGIVHRETGHSAIDWRVSSLTGATPVQYIELGDNGERRFVRYEEGVLRKFRLGDADKALVAASDLLVAPVYVQITDLFDDLMSVTTAGTTSIDFADFLQHPDFSLVGKYLDRIEVGFFGLTARETGMIEEIARLAAHHRKLLVVTLGADGSLAFDGPTEIRSNAVPVDKVVDTTGAGDAFAAGFLGKYCHGQTIAASLHGGATLAAEFIKVKGSDTT